MSVCFCCVRWSICYVVYFSCVEQSEAIVVIIDAAAAAAAVAAACYVKIVSYVSCPLTSDYRLAQLFLNQLSVDKIPVQGTDISGAVRKAALSLMKASEAKKDTETGDIYEFEPEEDEILSNLLPKNISTQIFKAMLENSASEQGSRMTAMDNATRNAGEMVDKLTIQYNRSRQAAITKELIEIISGAESL